VHRFRWATHPLLLVASYSPFARFRAPTTGPLVRAAEFVRRLPTDLQLFTGALGESCEAVCRSRQMVCHPQAIPVRPFKKGFHFM
jgi:hypothetical protein